MSLSRRLVAAGAVAWLSTSAPAQAAADEDLHIDAGAYTDFPVAVGSRSTLELPTRVRFAVGVAAFPRPYLDTIQGISTSAGWYSEELATVIDVALSRAAMVHLQGGWRPIEDRGFFATAGYMRVFAQGGEVGSTELAAATEQAAEEDFALQSRLHMASVQAGWEWLVRERLVLRGTVGGAFTVGAQTQAESMSESTSRFEAARSVGREVVEELLDQTYTSYVHTATVGVEVGYRFR